MSTSTSGDVFMTDRFLRVQIGSLEGHCDLGRQLYWDSRLSFCRVGKIVKESPNNIQSERCLHSRFLIGTD